MKTAYILVAEDDADDQIIFNAALSESGLPVKAIYFCDGNGLVAFLDELISDWPQCLFIDLNMPKMNGLETLQYIKSDHRLQHIPVIMMSTSGRREEIRRCIDNGAVNYMIKPDSFDKQILALKNMLMPYCYEPALPKPTGMPTGRAHDPWLWSAKSFR